jgi:hypothetical protein
VGVGRVPLAPAAPGALGVEVEHLGVVGHGADVRLGGLPVEVVRVVAHQATSSAG